jgi:small subunit ribosomal protein S21
VSDKFVGVEVRPRPNEDPEKLIRRYMKKLRNDGILQEVYQRRAYEKPSMKRRRKAARARFLRKLEEII